MKPPAATLASLLYFLMTVLAVPSTIAAQENSSGTNYLERAVRIARESVPKALPAVARAELRQGHTNEALKIVQEGVAAVSPVTIAVLQSELGERKAAAQTLSAINDPFRLCIAALGQNKAGDYENATKAIMMIQSRSDVSRIALDRVFLGFNILLQSNHWDQALAIARNTTNTHWKLQLMCKLGVDRSRRGFKAEAAKINDEALQELNRSSPDSLFSGDAAYLAASYAMAGNSKQAEELFERASKFVGIDQETQEPRAENLSEIARCRSLAGDTAEASEIVNRLEVSKQPDASIRREWLLADMAQDEAGRGHVEKAVKYLSKCQRDDSDLHNTAKAWDAAAEAIARAYVEANRVADLQQFAEHYQGTEKDIILRKAVEALKANSKFTEMLSFTDQLSPEQKAETVLDSVPDQIKNGQLAAAKVALKKIRPYLEGQSLVRYAILLCQAGLKEEALQTIIEIKKSIPDKADNEELYFSRQSELVEPYLLVGAFKEAEKIAEELPDSEEKIRALIALHEDSFPPKAGATANH